MSGRDSRGEHADNEPFVTTKSNPLGLAVRAFSSRAARRLCDQLRSYGRTTLCLGALLATSACAVEAGVSELGEPLDDLPVLDGNDGFGDANGEDSHDKEAKPITGGSLSNEVIYALMRDQTYRGEGFRRINSKPFASTVSPNKTVVLWVSDAGYEEFRRISADQAGSEAVLPVGTVVVREVLAGSELDTVTVMVKFPEGTFPLGGDFWYGAADPDGTIRVNANDGTPLAGMLENCGTCHLRRDRDAFIFGAPDGFADL